MHTVVEMNQVMGKYFRYASETAHTNIPLDVEHRVLVTADSGRFDRYVLEFRDPIPWGVEWGMKMAPSFANLVFRKMFYPQHHRLYRHIFHRRTGITKWLMENLQQPALIYRSRLCLYLATDDIDDITLLKLGTNEYRVDTPNWI